VPLLVDHVCVKAELETDPRLMFVLPPLVITLVLYHPEL
jgi:hypothetical protein